MAFTAVDAPTSNTKLNHPIRVMVVDDSAVVRGLVSRWVNEEDGMEAIARHSNGKLAVNDIARSDPDVVILDIEMPVMDGLEALPLLLEAKPNVKVIMASTLTRRNAEISLKAMSLGATDYVPKPEGNSGVSTSSDFRRDLLEKIKAVSRHAARTRALQHTKQGTTAKGTQLGQKTPATAAQANEKTISLRSFSNVSPRVLTIGSSTGGPQALLKVLETIAHVLDKTPILITQHMPPTFTTILAEHIGRATKRPSKEGEDGELVKSGHIYVAPGGRHMKIEKKGVDAVIRLEDGPEVNFCKPAVDPLFESVAKIFGAATLSVVLTGMGSDGANGAKIIADAGGSVIAQDEQTSVVWGMPGATAAAGACSAVLPLDQIGPKIISLLRGGV